MVFELAILIFGGSVLICGWLINPAVVDSICKRFAGKVSFLCRTFLKVLKKAGITASATLVFYPKGVIVSILGIVRHHRLFIGAAGALLIMPAALVLLRGPVVLEGYSVGPGKESVNGRLIASLLQGERLVTPAALPSRVFTSVEVERVRPRISEADRSWENLDIEFMRRLLVVYKVMSERYGYQMVLLEGYRSPEKQAGLSRRVTNAKPGQSYHQYGLAADSAFLRDGALVITEKDPWAMRGYWLYGEVAEEVGMTWGGRWKLGDFGHVEYRTSKSASRRNAY